jgi:hypothetical protein
MAVIHFFYQNECHLYSEINSYKQWIVEIRKERTSSRLAAVYLI